MSYTLARFASYFRGGLPETLLVIDAPGALERGPLVIRYLHWDHRLVNEDTWYIDLNQDDTLDVLPSTSQFRGWNNLGSRGWPTFGPRGMAPRDVFRDLDALISQLPPLAPIVGHGIFDRELPMLKHTYERLFGRNCGDILPRPVYDVGLIEKAIAGDLPPWAGEELAHFHWRVSQERLAGARWSLEACLDRHRMLLDPNDCMYRVRAAFHLYRHQDSQFRSFGGAA